MKIPKLDFPCFAFGSDKSDKEYKGSINLFSRNTNKSSIEANSNSPSIVLLNSFLGFESLSTILFNVLDFIVDINLGNNVQCYSDLKEIISKFSTDYYKTLIKSTVTPDKLKYKHKDNDTECIKNNINALWDMTRGISSEVSLDDKLTIVFDTYCGTGNKALSNIHSVSYYLFIKSLSNEENISKIYDIYKTYNDLLSKVTNAVKLSDITYDILRDSVFTEFIIEPYRSQVLAEADKHDSILFQTVSTVVCNSLESLMSVYQTAYGVFKDILKESISNLIKIDEIYQSLDIVYKTYIDYINKYKQQCDVITNTCSPYNPKTGFMIDMSKAECIMHRVHDKDSDEMHIRDKYKIYDLFIDSAARKYITKYYNLLSENSSLVLPQDVIIKLEDLMTFYTTRLELEDKSFNIFKRQITYAKFVSYVMTTSKAQFTTIGGFDFMNHPATQVIFDDLQRQLDKLDQLDGEGKQYVLDKLNESRINRK